MKKDNKEIKENNLIRIIKGSIASIIIALIMLLVFSVILSFTSVSEQVIPVGIIVISAVSTFLGSMFCNIKISKNGNIKYKNNFILLFQENTRYISKYLAFFVILQNK